MALQRVQSRDEKEREDVDVVVEVENPTVTGTCRSDADVF